MTGTDWQKTTIWERLEAIGSSAEIARRYVTAWLTEVETVLAKGATSPLDFTLHDDEHSFRVAQRMYELIPAETAEHLSDFEWSLLLQAAYLHDIGMNPRREMLQHIRQYLLSGTPDVRLGNEAEKLQQWLDNEEPGAQPPVYPELPVHQRVEKAEYLTAFFARHRHNDWSGDFIITESKTKGHPPYATWLEDLVTLCKSHHYGLEELMQPKFDLRIADSGSKLVNLRYLAALLRVADILEFDPERTPPVVLRLRNISQKSRIFWYKDQAIILAVNRDTKSLLFTARTKNAWVHKAVLETADAVDVELQNCAAIEQQGGFARGVRLDPTLYYAWPWPTRMARDIKPVDDTFVYVNGAFRPEPHRVLALLAGTRLYGSPLAAARELLQNAFDAAREQMAHQRLADPAGHTDATQQALSSLHHVDLEYEHNDGRIWLICKDTGVGMTRFMIERYLLVSGSQPRPEVLELQRRCAARSIDFERSGEFGIGVLSYFMVADKLIIETRASQEGHTDIEAHGWRFESDGLEDFGELKALKRTASGTTVRLRLKENFANESFLDAMHAYVKNVVVRAPCRLLLFKTGGGNIALPAGWTTGPDGLREYFLEEAFQYLDYSSNELKSRRRSTAEESKAERLAYLRTSAESKLRFTKPCEIKLPNNQGSARVHLPYFEIEGEASPYFVDQRNNIIHVLPDGKFGDMMKSKHFRSWRGFKASGSLEIRSSQVELNVLIETDLTRGAKISINRQRIDLDNEPELLTFIIDQISTTISELYTAIAKSPYAALCGTSILRYAIEQKSASYWAFARDLTASDEPLSWDWRPVQFPALFYSEKVGRYRGLLSKSLLAMAGAKDELRPIEFSATRQLMPVPWLKASRLVFSVLHGRRVPFVIFESGDSHRSDSRLSAKFPPEWRDILAVKHEGLLLFNEENPIFMTVAPVDWTSYLLTTDRKQLETVIEMVSTSHNSMAAAFMLEHAGEGSEFWNALHDNYLEHYRSILEACMPGQNKNVRIWKSDYESGVRTIGIDGAHFDKFEDGNYTKILPIPSDKSWELGSSLTSRQSIFDTE